MGNTVTILLPHGEVDSAPIKLAPRPASLAGKRIGFINNELWRSMHIICDELAKALTGEYGAKSTETIYVHPVTATNPGEYQEKLGDFSRKVDVSISGLGN
ncbi:hypothetical protein ACFLTS_03750 [Chloroflexota bacterium]